MLMVLVTSACGSESHEASTSASEGEADFISIHWPIDQPDVEARICIDYSTGAEIRVDPEPLISMRHFSAARVESGAVQPMVRLTDVGAERLATLTEANIGRALAVVVDGRVMAQPVIRAAITSGVIELMPMRGPEEAEALVERINTVLATLPDRNPEDRGS